MTKGIEKELFLTKQILGQERQDPLLTAIIWGQKMGSGKTSFALRVAHQVYRYKYGLSNKEAWKMALESLQFTDEDVINWFDKHKDKGITAPVTVLDDAQVHFSGSLWTTNQDEYKTFQKIFTTCRNRTEAIIVTTPHYKNVMEVFRLHCAYRVQISIKDKDRSYATYKEGRVWNRPEGKDEELRWFRPQKTIYTKNKFGQLVASTVPIKEIFPVNMPDDIFHEYKKERNAYNEPEINMMIKKYQKKKKQKEEELLNE